MKLSIIGISAILLISTLLLPSCDKNEYTPIPADPRSCNIEIECLDTRGENLLDDKSFTDKIKIEGESSHTIIKHEIKSGRLCFSADLPDLYDMKWSVDRRDATGISKMTVKLGKQKASLKCFFKYVANRPPAVSGGIITLEKVEYDNRTYDRSGNTVKIRIQFNNKGKI